MALSLAGAVVLTGCQGPTVAPQPPGPGRAPTPARPTATPIPTAPIFADPVSRQPIWPTPPVWCRTSPLTDQHADLGPAMGQFPIWLVSRPLPVLPWRNELIRTVWVVDRALDGDLLVSGRQTDGPALPQFIREGSERASEQLVVVSAPRIGSPTASPRAARYADIPVYLRVPQPGCYELTARIGEHVNSFTLYVYN